MEIPKFFDLSGRTIIITGAAGNLGSQYAEGLAQVGANLVLADIDQKSCKIIKTCTPSAIRLPIVSYLRAELT